MTSSSTPPISSASPAALGGAPARYDVDPGEVAALAAGLRRVRSAIQGQVRLDPTDPLGLGSALVAQELAELNRSWSVARTRLGHELDLLARAAGIAARAYSTVDGNVLRALDGSVGMVRAAGSDR